MLIGGGAALPLIWGAKAIGSCAGYCARVTVGG